MMKWIGGLLIVLGVVLVIVALNLHTTITTFSGWSPELHGAIASQVDNLALLQRQMIWLQIGLTTFLSGIVFLAAGIVAERNRHE
jgi:hypothetical protein